MSYFVELDNENLVLRVIVADSKEWCEQNLSGTWVQAHEPLDAAIGYTYDEDEDKFISPIVEPIKKLVEEPIKE
jgi:hypothetical protein